MVKVIGLLIFAIFFSSCIQYLDPSPPQKSKVGAEKANPTFALVKSSIFAPRCVSCHRQYESYEGVKRELSNIVSAVEANRMPKAGPPLTQEEKQLLLTWVASGALNDDGNPAPGPVVLEPSWKSVSENIFVPLCVVCHNPGGQAKFLDLSTQAAILESRDRVFAGGKKLLDIAQPNESYLLEVINDDNEPMPPKWSNLRRLNENEIRVLSEWIGLGLP